MDTNLINDANVLYEPVSNWSILSYDSISSFISSAEAPQFPCKCILCGAFYEEISMTITSILSLKICNGTGKEY